MKHLGFLKFYLSPKSVYRFFQMTGDGYLVESGWVESARRKRPVDKNGEPTPWFTTNFVAFLDSRLKPDFNVLEFGAGNSTMYFARRVKSVTSIEDNPHWYNELKSRLPANAKLSLLSGQAYHSAAATLGGKYHVIVVDGSDRYQCAANSLGSLEPGGVIILDNSLRPEYRPIYELLAKNGFRHIDFWGMAGGSRKHNCTTVFYRSGNCLGI
jgi:hypothetical protein